MTFHVSGGGQNFALYDDDGKTFDSERGQYSFTMLTVTKDSKGELRGQMAAVQAGKPFNYDPGVQWRFMTGKVE